MSNLIHIPNPLTPLQTPKSHDLPPNTIGSSLFQHIPNSQVLKMVSLVHNSIKNGHVRAVSNYREGFVQDLDSLPVSVQLEPVLSETQFDRIIAEAQQVEEPVVIVWMASWCRKCIYLKPKLEKLAAEFYPRIRFYCIDVNNVPHKLVVRAGVTKMPTIQLWKDCKKQAEVIGGHKAYLVVNEVREMIENEYTV